MLMTIGLRGFFFTLCLAALALLPVAKARAYTFTTLYHFTDKADGGGPLGGVVEDGAGTLYGETYYGGDVPCSAAPNGDGCGTVYSLSTTGSFKVLAIFNGENGAFGNITPVLIGKVLYGATKAGGASNDGVVFSVNTDGSNFNILHTFTGTDGAQPDVLIAGPDGKLYGAAEFGGDNNGGTLFSLSASGDFAVLHNFVAPTSSHPNTLVAAGNGMLVGSTIYGGSAASLCHHGCGTVFSFTPATGSFTTLYTFPSSAAEGDTPYVGSIGPGPTIYGGDSLNIFALSRQDGFTVLADLNPYTYGSGIQSGPLYTSGGTLYGVLSGSITATDGLIYSLQDGVINDLYIFAGSLDGASGANAVAQPIITPTGSLIGTTSEGGYCNPCGTVWEYTP
jgi:uncharacterized repeat protein (TIGR03803 family)